jgi:NitT/TauT family transport system permease protein
VTSATSSTSTETAPKGGRLNGGATRAAVGKVGYGLFGALLVVVLWFLIAVTGVVGNGLVPRPDEVAVAMWQRFAHSGLLFDLRVSVTRVLIGVAVGCLIALPVGFLLAWYPRIRAVFEPLVNFFRALPPIALIPLVIVYFGIGELARISILVYASFFAAVVVLYEGISSLDPIYVRAARALGATSWEVFSRCVAPASVPHLFTALRVALGVSWATLVAAELIAASRGLGAVIQTAGNFFQIPDIYVGIILIGCCALVMDYLLKVIQARATKWQERTQR